MELVLAKKWNGNLTKKRYKRHKQMFFEMICANASEDLNYSFEPLSPLNCTKRSENATDTKDLQHGDCASAESWRRIEERLGWGTCHWRWWRPGTPQLQAYPKDLLGDKDKFWIDHKEWIVLSFLGSYLEIAYSHPFEELHRRTSSALSQGWRL